MAELEPGQSPSEEIIETETVHVPAPHPTRPRKVYAGMWGPLEIAVVSVGVLAIIAASVLYFVWVVPSNRELVRNRSEADRLEAEVLSARTKYGEITDTQAQVTKITSSVDDFEMRFLPVVSTGQAALYQRINSLLNAYSLENTTGPDYAPLETVDKDTGEQSDTEKGRSKFRSLYPGVYVTMTVEGSYQNLRRFIREIETGREFVIVSRVELAPSDSEGKKPESDHAPTAQPNGAIPVGPNMGVPPGKGMPAGLNPNTIQTQQSQAQARAPKGKAHGDVVSLHIELAAYFRRANFSPVQTQ
jgi:hypothetical protein